MKVIPWLLSIFLFLVCLDFKNEINAKIAAIEELSEFVDRYQEVLKDNKALQNDNKKLRVEIKKLQSLIDNADQMQ